MNDTTPKLGQERDPNRIPEVLQALQRCWETQPTMRLGQLLVCMERNGLFSVEDSALVAHLNHLVSKGKWHWELPGVDPSHIDPPA